MKIIFNGELVDQVNSPCTSDGWLEGTGIFETIRTVDGKPWALSRHMRRAVNSARKMKIPLPGEEAIRASVFEILESQPLPTGRMRISFDLSGNWAIAHLIYVQKKNKAKIWVDTTELVEPGVAIKSYPYDHRLSILDRARDLGFDEAILCNSKGNVCEAAVSNLLVKIAGRWFTPPLSDGVLPGIMRALVIENLDVTVRSIAQREIEEIESAFLLSSLRIAQPVFSINNRELSQSPKFQDEIEAMALRTSVG